MSSSLVIRAGARARAQLERDGWRPGAFTTLVGASGGPKWLVLSRIDRALAGWLLADRKEPLDLLGSSIGSFRHAALSRRDPIAAIGTLERAYVEQRYDSGGRPSQAEVSGETTRIVEAMLEGGGAGEIVGHPFLRNHVVTARWRAGRRGTGAAFRAGLGAAALANAASRASLGAFFERIVFAPEVGAVRFRGDGAERVTLCEDNLARALAASGSIPLLMEGVLDPAGARLGLYLDGGILDYHFDFRFRTAPGLILFPHFFDRITPGWFDKPLRWRRPHPDDLDRVVTIAPSQAFVASLPGAKVPDRADFEELPSEERIGRWWAVVERCRELEAEVWALWSGAARAEVLPFER